MLWTDVIFSHVEQNGGHGVQCTDFAGPDGPAKTPSGRFEEKTSRLSALWACHGLESCVLSGRA